MAIYTWTGNKSRDDYTSRLILNDGSDMLIGENHDLSQTDLDELSPYYNFSPGVVAVDLSLFPWARATRTPGVNASDQFYGYARLNSRGQVVDGSSNAVGSTSSPDSLVTTADGQASAGRYPVERPINPLQQPSRYLADGTSAAMLYRAFSTWTGGAEDTSHTVFGSSYRITTNGSGAVSFMNTPTFTAQNWTGMTLRLLIEVDDASKLNVMSSYLYTDGSNGIKGSIPGTSNIKSGEPMWVTVPRNGPGTGFNFSNFGTGGSAFAAIVKLAVTAQDKSGGAINAWVHAAELIPDLSSVYGSAPVFVLYNDDGRGATTYDQLLRITEPRGIPVTHPIIVDRFKDDRSGLSGKNAADLRGLQNNHGWAVTNHAYAQAVHDGSTGTLGRAPTNAEVEQDLLRSKQWLQAQGLHVGSDDYAIAPGVGSPVGQGTLRDTLAKYVRTARTTGGNVETTIPADPWSLRAYMHNSQGASVINTNVKLAACPGGAFHFVTHDVVAGSTDSGLSVSATTLTSIIDNAISLGFVFRTLPELLARR